MKQRFKFLPQETRLAIAELKHTGAFFALKSPYHIKICQYNYYPKSRTIHIDGEVQSEVSRGVSAFVALIQADPRTARFIGGSPCDPAIKGTSPSQMIDLDLSDIDTL